MKKVIPVLLLLAATFARSAIPAGTAEGRNTTVLPTVLVTATAPTNNPKADKAWRELKKTTAAEPLPPIGFLFKAVFGRPRTEELRDLFGTWVIPVELQKADAAHNFSQRFPEDSRALSARVIEYQHLGQGYRVVHDLTNVEAELKARGRLTEPQKFSFTNVLPRMLLLEKEFMAATNLTEDQRFVYRREQVYRLAHYGPSREKLDSFIEAAAALQKDFPQKRDGYAYLRQAMEDSSAEKARGVAEGIVGSKASEEEKAPFMGFIHRLDSEGKETAIRFTSLEGKEVDTAKMHGKVVLVVFWATWCSPCVAEAPALKAVYDKFHGQGLEIIGISLDEKEDRGKLVTFLKQEKIPWPQYFDGQGPTNKIALEFGIDGIPAHFLLDKHGVLRDTNARAGLEQKIKNLLAEP